MIKIRNIKKHDLNQTTVYTKQFFLLGPRQPFLKIILTTNNKNLTRSSASSCVVISCSVDLPSSAVKRKLSDSCCVTLLSSESSLDISVSFSVGNYEQSDLCLQSISIEYKLTKY